MTLAFCFRTLWMIKSINNYLTKRTTTTKKLFFFFATKNGIKRNDITLLLLGWLYSLLIIDISCCCYILWVLLGARNVCYNPIHNRRNRRNQCHFASFDMQTFYWTAFQYAAWPRFCFLPFGLLKRVTHCIEFYNFFCLLRFVPKLIMWCGFFSCVSFPCDL